MATVREVNAALRAAGHAERLVRGRGYYYFVDGDSCRWPATSVWTNSIVAWSVAELVAERDTLAGASSAKDSPR